MPTLTVEDVLVQDYEDLLNKAQNLVQAQVKMIEDYEAIEKFKEKSAIKAWMFWRMIKMKKIS